MKYRIIIGHTMLFLLLLASPAFACRFTVREIGFSILSRDVYTIVVANDEADAADPIWKEYRKRNRSANLRLTILNPLADANHPTIIQLKNKNIAFPAKVVIAPNGNILQLSDTNFPAFYSKIYKSPVREQLRKAFPSVFATVLWIEGKDGAKNKQMQLKVTDECAAIKNIMPNMPKIVKEGPVAIRITAEQMEREQVLLWSLGINAVPDEPIAFVIYGRGRIIGQGLGYQQVLSGKLYDYMSMIGADCECGLDKKWMLGGQIPLWWPAETRQKLVDEIDIDVDNPMILAEMSRILAKESQAGAGGIPTFAPETIDLNEAFSDLDEKNDQAETIIVESNSIKALYYSAGILILLLISGGLLVLLRNKKRG